MSFQMSRKQYAEMYGPTTGDTIRLADTDLLAEIEHDYTNYGEEVSFGGGKVIRDGMGQNGQRVREDGVPDTVITNVVVLNYTGIYKADVALRDGHIFGIGKAGNPLVQDGVTIPVGVATDVISGEHKILTAGAIDNHVHFINPDQVGVALANGTSTVMLYERALRQSEDNAALVILNWVPGLQTAGFLTQLLLDYQYNTFFDEVEKL